MTRDEQMIRLGLAAVFTFARILRPEVTPQSAVADGLLAADLLLKKVLPTTKPESPKK